jgi:membrane dipeptidase
MSTERHPPSFAARRLFNEAIVIDGLNTSNWGEEGIFRDLRDGGLTAVNASVAVWEGFQETMDLTASWLHWFADYAAYIRPIRRVADIRTAKGEGRTGIILGWQNTSPVENDIRRFRLFHELGVRVVQLTYNERNLFGDGCWEPNDGGLSHIGRAAIGEMNELGILIDLSHVGDRTVLETIEHSKQPVAFTHANARSQFDHPRNKTDEAIRKLAQGGGVVGANAIPGHHPNAYESTLEDYLQTVDYLVQMVGIDHVAIGTDFCMGRTLEWFGWIGRSHGLGPTPVPPKYQDEMEIPQPYRALHGFSSPLEFVNVADGLLSLGYDEEATRKILGENWLRLFGQVWGED